MTHTISKVASCLFVTLLLIGCDDSGRYYHYAHYRDIPQSEGISTWIPDVFPENATDLILYTHVETGAFDAYFTLTDEDSLSFEKQFHSKTSSKGDKYLSRYNKNILSYWCVLSPLQSPSYIELYLISKITNDRGENRYYLNHPLDIRYSREPREKALQQSIEKYCLKKE